MEVKHRFMSEIMIFIEKLQIPTDAVEDTLRKVNVAVNSVAESIGIGKIVLDLDAPASPYMPEGEKCSKNIYDWQGESEAKAYSIQLETGEKGIADIHFYPRKNRKWGEDEQDFLQLIGYFAFLEAGGSRKSELLRKAMYTDLQTGLMNINGFITHGKRLIAEGKLGQYTAVYFNIQKFRYVNRTMGYMCGNHVLRAYASRMREFIRGDEAVSRLGGDTFVVLVEDSRIEQFLQLIRIMNLSLQQDKEKKDITFGVTCGVYKVSPENNIMGEVMMAVSAAFQEAKNRQLPVAFYSEEMFLASMHEKDVQMRFPGALSRGEIKVYYQPKVGLSNNIIKGAEALARWEENGEVHSPAYFVPALEKDGSICKLDFYMLDKACKKIKSWMDSGKEPIVISVNFSRYHLKNPFFADEITDVLSKNGIPGKYIEIEVTETVNNEDFQALMSAINKMKENDISVSIDDFGTGYSSLTMLRQIPADILKMDKSFLNDEIQERDKKMLNHIVGMARDLSMQVLAEGVENISQRDYLRGIGCDTVQGFLYDKPLPEKDFDKRLELNFKYEI